MNITKKNVRITIVVLLIILLVAVLWQNSAGVTLRFFSLQLQMPLFGVVLGSTAFGLGLGWLLKSRKF